MKAARIVATVNEIELTGRGSPRYVTCAADTPSGMVVRWSCLLDDAPSIGQSIVCDIRAVAP